MTPKSVSGSSLILCSLVLSLPMWGWAGEAKDPMKACLGNACVVGMSRDTMDKLACFQRMREAMSSMKKNMRPDPNSRSLSRGFVMTEQAWEKDFEPIYKDCVEGEQ